MSLNAAEITELTTESAPYTILKEWLQDYFDGNLHSVGNNAPVVFPPAAISFGQSEAVQPLHKGAGNENLDVEIRIVMIPRMEERQDAVTVMYAGKLVTDYVLFNFWIAAKRPGPGQSQYLAMQVAQLLKALLTNPDTRYALAEKGIGALQPQDPQTITSTDYAKRLVACGAQLQYAVQFGDQVVTPPAGSGSSNVLTGLEQTVIYFQNDPLLTGVNIPGEYVWAQPRKLISARLTAYGPSGSTVVLGLMVNGQLTGDQLVIPAITGTPPQEVEAVVALNVEVASGQPVRWQVISAPIAESSASHVALVLDTVLG